MQQQLLADIEAASARLQATALNLARRETNYARAHSQGPLVPLKKEQPGIVPPPFRPCFQRIHGHHGVGAFPHDAGLEMPTYRSLVVRQNVFEDDVVALLQFYNYWDGLGDSPSFHKLRLHLARYLGCIA
nr:hypothetical protein HK105_001485 [Polyrhizophydium stewartii]